MKIALLLSGLIFLASCSDKGAMGETVKLETTKDKLSYSLGAEQARMITESGDPNFDKLDKEAMVKGFRAGLSSGEIELSADCRTSLQKLYGPYGQDFNVKEVVAGSECIGRMAGAIFYNGWQKKGSIEQIDLVKAEAGFLHGLSKQDTLVDMKERTQIVTDFVTKLNKKLGSKMLADAKKRPNTRSIDGGIIIETIQEGTGASPAATDDVVADYVLTNASGDTIENSIKAQAMNPQMTTPAFNLGGVIPGWTQAFQSLRKGGKYRLFIPWNLAYGERGGYESLTFFIDFKNFGPAGTLVKPQEMPQQGF